MRNRARNLSGDECRSPPWALVIEQHSIAAEHPVRLTVIDGHPIRINLRCTIGTAGVERRLFVLGRRRRPEHLRGTGLVETGGHTTPADGVKKSGCPQSRDVASVFGVFKANHDMALGA